MNNSKSKAYWTKLLKEDLSRVGQSIQINPAHEFFYTADLYHGVPAGTISSVTAYAHEPTAKQQAMRIAGTKESFRGLNDINESKSKNLIKYFLKSAISFNIEYEFVADCITNAINNVGAFLYKYIEEEKLKSDLRIQLATVNKNGFFIRYIKDPIHQIQIAAVQETPWCIRYIDNPSYEVILFLKIEKDLVE